MKKYFLLQLKRLVKTVPMALCVATVLFGALSIVMDGLLRMDGEQSENKKFRIGVCGTASDNLLNFGISALQTFDETRFSMQLVQMEEQEAIAQLRRGEIAAYVVIPEGFTDEAMYGNILPIRYVTTAGAVGVDSLFKAEITGVINQILLASQRGVYSAYAVLAEHGLPDAANTALDDLALEYVALVFQRASMYALTLGGVGNAPSLGEYLLCGITVLFIFLACLSFAPAMIRSDLSLNQMLVSRGKGAMGQAACDFAAYFAALMLLFSVLTALAGLLGLRIAALREAAGVLVRGTPVVFTAAAMSFLLYSCARDLTSGVLLQFLTVIALCFVCGCMYPITFFPETLQTLAPMLPAGAAREYLSACLQAKAPAALLPLCGYGIVFALCGCARRAFALREAGR